MYKQQTQCKRNTTGLRDTRQHLDDCTLTPTGASHKHLHINPIKKREKERSRNFPCARRPTARSPRASRASRLSCLSSTCASQQRAPLSNVRFSPAHRQTRALSPSLSVSDHSATSFHLSHVLTRALLNTSFHRTLSKYSPTRAPLCTCAHRTLSKYSATRAPLCTCAHRTLFKYSDLLSPSHCAPPSSGRVASVSANRERTRRPSPLPFLASETGR